MRFSPACRPAWIGVGTNDQFHDEDVAYARRLQEAGGVPCTLHVIPRAYHAFDMIDARAGTPGPSCAREWPPWDDALNGGARAQP